MKPYVIGVTGASGIIYAVHLIKVMTELGYPLEVIVSEAARIVFQEEYHSGGCAFTRREHFAPYLSPSQLEKITVHAPRNFAAPLASGSYPVAGMIVIPCSMGTLGAIASGLSQNLIHRAADCMMKEGRPLILVPRETPLNAIHLENMLKLVRLGVRMVPAMPGFYTGVEKIEDLVDFIVGKVLDQLGISHGLYPRWVGSTENLSQEIP